MTNNLIALQAREFARAKHAEQKRKYTGEPYFVHLEEVAELVRTFGVGEEAEVLAYLHDTVEDTATTHAELVEKFGVQIALGVRALTNTPKDTGNRKTRKEIDRRRLADAPAVVQSVKCADMISNARDLVHNDPKFAVVFLDEMDDLVKVLRQAHSGLHQFAHMVGQVEQLYLFLNDAKKDKEAKDVPHTSTQTNLVADSVPQAGTPA
jgi:(p)ppGpp synthase/HD superfamily hydrolase